MTEELATFITSLLRVNWFDTFVFYLITEPEKESTVNIWKMKSSHPLLLLQSSNTVNLPQIKHSNTAVSSHASEYVPSTPRPAESYIEHFFIVSYQLSSHHACHAVVVNSTNSLSRLKNRLHCWKFQRLKALKWGTNLDHKIEIKIAISLSSNRSWNIDAFDHYSGLT
jgi:hypothetical protein